MTITRRHALALCATPLLAKTRRSVSITMDDVRWQMLPEAGRLEAEQRLLAHFGKTKAFLFAIGQVVDQPHGQSILASWNARGHLIGNHTYSHRPLSGAITTAEFEADILRCEETLRAHPNFRKWFRFPTLNEGQTREQRDHIRAFLTQHGYRNAPVTIDASDWYYNNRLLDRLKREPAFDANRYRQPYLDHIWDRARFYDQLSADVLGRSVPHTLLIHYNFINSLFLGDMLAMFRAKGWAVIDAEEALSDKVFTRLPDTVPAGQSLIWALAKESGKFDARLRYPGEDGEYEAPSLDRLGL